MSIEQKKSKRLSKHAVMDKIDIEMDSPVLPVGTDGEKQFYSEKWEETYQAVIKSGYFDGYPEWWESTGYTKEELDFSWVLQDNVGR